MINVNTYPHYPNRKRSFILALILLLLLIIGGMDFLHNHQPGLIGDENCPVFHLQMLLSSVMLILAFYTIFLQQKPFFKFISSLIKVFDFATLRNPRSPPQIFQIHI